MEVQDCGREAAWPVDGRSRPRADWRRRCSTVQTRIQGCNARADRKRCLADGPCLASERIEFVELLSFCIPGTTPVEHSYGGTSRLRGPGAGNRLTGSRHPA